MDVVREEDDEWKNPLEKLDDGVDDDVGSCRRHIFAVFCCCRRFYHFFYSRGHYSRSRR